MNKQGVKIVIVLLAVLVLTPVDVFATNNDGQGNRRLGPPPEAVSACIGMQAGDSVVFSGENSETITALCLEHNGQLVAVPEPIDQLNRQDRQKQSFSLVDTGQGACYDSTGIEINCPSVEMAFYGQDAQFEGP